MSILIFDCVGNLRLLNLRDFQLINSQGTPDVQLWQWPKERPQKDEDFSTNRKAFIWTSRGAAAIFIHVKIDWQAFPQQVMLSNGPTVSNYPGKSQTQIAQKKHRSLPYKHLQYDRESSFRSQWDKGLFFKPFTKSWISWKLTRFHKPAGITRQIGPFWWD